MSEKHNHEESFVKEIVEDIREEAHEASVKTQHALKDTSSWISKNKIIVSILAAAVLIAGSLIFLAVKLGNGGSSSSGSFAEQMAAYQAEEQKKQELAMADQQKVAQEQAKNVKPIAKEDHVLGDRDAKITIFEYSDFECPFCKSFAPTGKEAVKRFNGDVNLVYRHFPLDFHDPHATDAALGSECAADLGGNDAFWKFHDIYYERTKSNKGLEKSALYAIANDLGVNQADFKNCIDTQKFIGKVRGDLQEGSQVGVTGTPGNIIRNNKTKEVILLPGAYPIESVEAAIKDLLN